MLRYALRLTEKCGRREAVYVFPLFVDGLGSDHAMPDETNPSGRRN